MNLRSQIRNKINKGLEYRRISKYSDIITTPADKIKVITERKITFLNLISSKLDLINSKLNICYKLISHV